jgi:hypothetical protein
MLTQKQKKYIKIFNACLYVDFVSFFVMVFTVYRFPIVSYIAGALCFLSCMVAVIMPHVVDMEEHW